MLNQGDLFFCEFFGLRMVTYEFIISSAGAQKAHDPIREALRRKLRAITEPILRQRIQPFVWASYPKAGAVCHSMIRRYLEHERRSHDTHWDIPSYVSVVVSLDSTNLDFEGWLLCDYWKWRKILHTFAERWHCCSSIGSFTWGARGQWWTLELGHVVSRFIWLQFSSRKLVAGAAAMSWKNDGFFFDNGQNPPESISVMCRIIPPKESIFPYISILFRIETFHPSPFFFPGWSRERRSGGTDLACHACKHCRRKLEMVETSCREWFSTSTALLWQSLRRWLSSKTSTTRSCRVVWEITAQWGSGCLLLGPFWHLSFAKWRKVAVVWPTKATDDLLIVEIFITSNNNRNRLYHRPTKLQGFYLGLWEQKRGNVSGAMKLFEQGAHFGDGKVQYWRRLGKGVYEIRYNVQ